MRFSRSAVIKGRRAVGGGLDTRPRTIELVMSASHPRERRARMTGEEMRASLEARIKVLEDLLPSILRAMDGKAGSKTFIEENADLSNEINGLKERVSKGRKSCRGQGAVERGNSKPRRAKGQRNLSMKLKKGLQRYK